MNGDRFQQLYEKDRQDWEPRDPSAWEQSDPLLQTFRRNDILIPKFEANLVSFHQAWIRLPQSWRVQVAREREIAASLVQSLSSFREFVPGLLSVGVGFRGADEPELTAIVTVEERLAGPEWNEIRRRWTQYAYQKSRIPAFTKPQPVPLKVELRPPLTLLGKVPPDSFLFGEPEPPPEGAPVLQSGDKIGSESPSGIREYGTLSCFVHDPSSPKPLLLASGHVLRKKGYPVLSSRNVPVRVGRVTVVEPDLDVALAEPFKPYICDFRVQGADMVPGPPVIGASGMPVQMFGAMSKHQRGFINQGIDIPANATSAGVSTTFTADVTCVHGDSGALLITGRGSEPAVPNWQRKYMALEYLDSLKCAILGVLKAGPTRDADTSMRAQGYFVPILQVLNELAVDAWVR